MNISVRLKQARQAKHLTQHALEELSGVKQGTISKIERGGQVSTKFVVSLAKSLGVSAEWLEIGDGDDTQTRIEKKIGLLTTDDMNRISRLTKDKQKTIKALLAAWSDEPLD